jgi:hypothetical protein
VTEKEFWTALEFRICGELAGVLDNSVRFWWCDGFIPEPTPRGREIHGDVWMCDGPRQFKWRFKLKLPRGFDPTSQDWSPLLPAQDVTGWLSMDKEYERIAVDPANARPDGQPATG